MPKQDSSLAVMVDCIWRGRLPPPHFSYSYYTIFPYFLAREKAVKSVINNPPSDGVWVRLFVFLSMRFVRKLRRRKK